MIPQTAITHWRNVAPWPRDSQVEQDLILTRALVEIFGNDEVTKSLILRGGTALHKLYIASPMRYSADIDLVQHTARPIGKILNALRARLDPILGKPVWEKKPKTVILKYRMESEIPPVVPIRLKVEINTREHFDVFGVVERRLKVQSPWFSGETNIKTYTLNELLATKMRALYQRRKGRDLFDLWVGLRMKTVYPRRIVEAFKRYMKAGKNTVSRKQFIRNLENKITSRQFHDDLRPLLAPNVDYHADRAAKAVSERLLSLL